MAAKIKRTMLSVYIGFGEIADDNKAAIAQKATSLDTTISSLVLYALKKTFPELDLKQSG